MLPMREAAKSTGKGADLARERGLELLMIY
jgi:hypothetical protein